MNSTHWPSYYTEKPEETNRDFVALKDEQASAIEREVISISSVNSFPTYKSNILQAEGNDIKMTLDKIKMPPIQCKVENCRDEMNMDRKDMDIQCKGGMSVKTEKVKEELVREGMENTIIDVAELKSNCRIIDKCERDIKIEVVLPINHKVENVGDEMNVDGKDMESKDKGRILMQTVKKERLEVVKELPLEETINTSSFAKLKSDYESVDVYSVDECKRDIKLETVFFDEEYREIAENEEQNVHVKSEAEMCEDYKIDIVDNFLTEDFVKDEREKDIDEYVIQYICGLCNIEFPSESDLSFHKCTHPVEQQQLYQKRPNVCHFCAKRFVRKEELTKHVRIHTNERPYKCSFCDKRFRQKFCVKLHETVHIEEKHSKCRECEKSFLQQDKSDERRSVHASERPFECEHRSRFIGEQERDQHEKTAHGSLRRFPCPFCPKLFKQKNALTSHVKIHKIQRPYSCSVCGRAFVYRRQLTEHARVHSTAKPFACQLCDKTFKTKKELQMHQVVHSNERKFACTACEKTFKVRSALVKHLKGHGGERPYACSVCDKRFLRQYDMTAHQRIHSNARPYGCGMCDKKFKQRNDLMKHTRKVHQKHIL